jgi:hypothetical protein
MSKNQEGFYLQYDWDTLQLKKINSRQNKPTKALESEQKNERFWRGVDIWKMGKA